MSEMKRVELTTVSSSQKQKKVKWKQSTYRFILTLGESNAENMSGVLPLNGTPFDEPDEDKEVAAIAQRFEAKYGPKGLISGKRKRTQEMDDYYDPGEGYDEDDPFIDNTEAVSVKFVPSHPDHTARRFYINQGKLDFKYLDEDSSDAFANVQEVKKPKKKRVLDSDSEEETGAAIAKKFKAMKAMKRKKQLESKSGEKQRKKHSGLEDGDKIFKKKKLKNLDKLKLQKSTPDSVAQQEAVTPPVPSPNVTTPSPSVMVSSPFAPTNKSIVPPLANHIIDGVQGMPDTVQEAKENKEKKLRFFSDGVNKLLLDIELGSRNLPWGSRTAIYGHLGEHLPCGKNALQRRAKKLRESQQEGQLKLPMQKLKEAVMKVMPGLEEQHELEVQRAKNESELKEGVADVKEEASTESEEEEKTENKKKPRGPRRKFQWTSEIRDLLLDIVSTKMKLFSTSKSRNQTAEEYLKAFLDSEIKPIWPQGWIQTRMLFKESKKAHEDLTKGSLQPPQQKSTAPQQMANSQQHKHPQELPKVANQQQNKAAMRSSTLVGSLHNSTGAHVNSVVPATKSINPFVAVHRIPETATQKLSLGGKSSSSSLQQNQTVMPLIQQQEKTLNNSNVGLKPNQPARKLQQSETNAFSGATSSDIPQAKKLVTSSQNSVSSRLDSQTKTVVHQPTGPHKNSQPPSPHSKSGIMGGTSCIPTQNTSANSGLKLNQQNQHIKPSTGLLLGSQSNSRGNANIPNMSAQSQPTGGIRQHSPPANLLGFSDKPAAGPVSPPIVLLDISSSPSMSRSNTPSPQKSPVSPPGNAALSLYEQIKSQIWHQEAMEDQALKNLALALNCGGSDASRMYGKCSELHHF
ncbi:unnamed protein product [Candidula unifasciata]|uniref:Ubinuclein-1 n=1 Tax=Candidula unifasciata TaxID=100452 RepID=A0A8S4A2V2_9EUPU|nr:unnamed protein product [Candidula unifasciata]